MQHNSLLTVILSVFLSVLVAYGGMRYSINEPMRLLSLTSPVFVMNKAELVKSIPPDSSPEVIQAAIDKWQASANKLAKEGYIVIDASFVIAAPEDVYVNPGK